MKKKRWVETAEGAWHIFPKYDIYLQANKLMAIRKIWFILQQTEFACVYIFLYHFLAVVDKVCLELFGDRKAFHTFHTSFSLHPLQIYAKPPRDLILYPWVK